MTEKVIPLQPARDAASLDALLAADEQTAETMFNRLPLQKKVQQIIAAPWDKRVRLILLAENARAVVQAMPSDELYWTVKHHGPEDALAVISLTSHEQFQYIVDIDCWNQDELDPAAVTRWYRLLSKCHEDKVLEWFLNADEPLLIGTLKQFLHVVKLEEHSDISEEYAQMPAYTLDGVYYFNFLRDDAHAFIMPLLNAVYQTNPQRLYSLLEGVQSDSAPEVIEEALRWRNSRIAECGFPEPEEAASIYQFVSDKEIGLLRKGCAHRTDGGRTACVVQQHGLTRHNLAVSGMPTALAEALRLLPSEEVGERVQRLIVHVANKVLCADGRPINSAADAAQGMKKALGFIGIGLELLSGDAAADGALLLEHVHPEILFRVGNSAVSKLQNRLAELRKTFWRAAPRSCIQFFDTPWSDALQGLVLKRPLLFEGLRTAGALDYRDFMTMQDIRALEAVVDTVEAVSSLLFSALGINQEYLFTDFIKTTTLSDPADLKSSAVFLTIVANKVISENPVPAPLSAAALQQFLQEVFVYREEQQRHSVNGAFAESLRAWLVTVYPCGERLQTALDGFVNACLAMLEDEFSLLIDKKTIDTRFVTGLLLSSCG